MYSRITLLVVLVINVVVCSKFRMLKNRHVIEKYNNRQIQYVAGLTDTQHMNTLLDNILVPRVVGTSSHTKVYNYIQDQLEENGFTVEIDQFHDETPLFGRLRFKNIIGMLNPNAERFLVLACHYDSKYFEGEDFIGASDSGVPCAMMLNLIHTMKRELQAIKDNDVSLMLLFLDGEEAFKEWTDTDSIYGARNLAKVYDRAMFVSKTNERVSMLERMDLFVLLDLLGPANPTFYSYFENTERHYLVVSRAEDALEANGLLVNHKRKYFRESARNHGVQDDHVPFMARDVPILHVIPSPFPKVWHTMADNRAAIDMNTVENLNKIFRVSVAEYLHLPIHNDADDEMDTRSRLHEEF